MTSIGINIGAVSVKYVELDAERRIVTYEAILHKGQPYNILMEIKRKYTDQVYYAISGSGGQINEVEAISCALAEEEEEYDAIISLGGESFLVYLLKDNKIQNILSHNRCAAGSGEFIVQQVKRLGLTLEEAIKIGSSGNSIRLANRCSVHCKSDITHKLNRREASVEDILWSLHESMGQKIISLIEKVQSKINKILVIGGLSQNEVMIEVLQKNMPNKEIIVKDACTVYEALGSAYYAFDYPLFEEPKLHIEKQYSSSSPLLDAQDLVTITKIPNVERRVDSKLLLGIDGGSTTTKAVVVNVSNYQILASHYTRTNGNPINATKECLESIISQMGDQKIAITGVTGSARDIIASYVGTSHVYNEISAHAKGAAFFDPDVDTIFEIGGQDAKYIFLENQVPVDYAMNAACSAGTGSFLEESASGDLGISVYDISDIALAAPAPIELKAECAAFINSDIRTALQEGHSKENIIGGLVSSIVDNYLTKVKGQRKVGKKIFFQGGVAKNHAVAYAFGQETGKEIIVPPYPELMGAYGVALISEERQVSEDISEVQLTELKSKEMIELKGFTCRACDNYCHIQRYQVGERKFPFGGACSRYENRWKQLDKIEDVEDYVELRNELMFSIMDDYNTLSSSIGMTIVIPRALTTHFLFPLYYSFLRELGFDVKLSDIDPKGELKAHAPFCFPTQIAHGAILDTINKRESGVYDFDYVFFPQIKRMPDYSNSNSSYLCPITQSSPFVLKKAFKEINFLTPSIDFSRGYRATSELIDFMVEQFSFNRKTVNAAYELAILEQESIEAKMRDLGERALEAAISSSRPAIILAGRSYNAFPKETSQSISKKLSSKGIITIPHDCLGVVSDNEMPWYFSNLILNAVSLTNKHENLFLLYINNFGCSIDSFTQEVVQEKIFRKPYLKLEIDSHTADAGTQTRLEAFLEIIHNYSKITYEEENDQFTPARIEKIGKEYLVRDSQGELAEITDSRVKIQFPIFSQYHNDSIAMVMRWMGYSVTPILSLDQSHMQEGLQHTSGRECLPLPIYLGQLLEIYRNKAPEDIIGVYMISNGEPCVVSAYPEIFEKFIKDNKLENVFLFDPKPENDQLGFNVFKLYRYLPFAISLGDIINEIRNVLAVVGEENSIDRLNFAWNEQIELSTSKSEFDRHISNFVNVISNLPKKIDPKECPVVDVTGDFFVRFDPFFYQGLVDKYAEHNIILSPVDLNELILYPMYDRMYDVSDIDSGEVTSKLNIIKSIPKCLKSEGRAFLGNFLSAKFLEFYDRRIRDMFKSTGLLVSHGNDIEAVISYASDHIDRSIYGESVLTIGRSLESINNGVDGLIILGPFSCLPFRVSEAIMKPLALEYNFPIISYETDGRPIPYSFERIVDVHIQQVLRKHKHKVDNSVFQPFDVLQV